MSDQIQNRVYNGKIMLFGEYSVIEGSSAILIPYRKVWARLSMSESIENDEKAIRSNVHLRTFAEYLANLFKSGLMSGFIELSRLKDHLERGLFLDSTIPQNYGLGSSGAMCASVYESYRIASQPEIKHSYTELRTVFSEMESYFHGSSSGLDPLCVFLGESLVIRDDKITAIVPRKNNNQNKLHVFLLDTCQTSHTGPYVRYFLEQMTRTPFRMEFNKNYVPLVNQAVEQWTSGRIRLGDVLEISKAQWNFFQRMIPVTFRELWKQGIETGLYACKLCGSGGGGMILGFTENMEQTGDFFRNNFKISLSEQSVITD